MNTYASFVFLGFYSCVLDLSFFVRYGIGVGRGVVFVRVTFSFESCILPERYSTIIHFRSLGPFYRLLYIGGFVGVDSLFWLVECFGGFLWEITEKSGLHVYFALQTACVFAS